MPKVNDYIDATIGTHFMVALEGNDDDLNVQEFRALEDFLADIEETVKELNADVLGWSYSEEYFGRCDITGLRGDVVDAKLNIQYVGD